MTTFSKRLSVLGALLLFSLSSVVHAQRTSIKGQYPADDPAVVGPSWITTFQPSPAPPEVGTDKQYDPSISGRLDLVSLTKNLAGPGGKKLNTYLLGIPIGIPTSPRKKFYRFNARIVPTGTTPLASPFITAVYPGRELSAEAITSGISGTATLQPSFSGISVGSLAVTLSKSKNYTQELKLVQGDPTPDQNLVSWDFSKQDGSPIDTGLHEFFVALTCPADWSGSFSAQCMLTDESKKAEKGKDMKHKWFTVTPTVSTKDSFSLDSFIMQHLSLEPWAVDLFKAYQDALKGNIPAAPTGPTAPAHSSAAATAGSHSSSAAAASGSKKPHTKAASH